MKYIIGQRMFENWLAITDEELAEQEDTSEIVCIGIFGDGTWKYGVVYDNAEYSNMIDFYTEEELEKEFVIRKGVK